MLPSQINQKALDDFKADVLKRYPNEACGFICGEEYVPVENTHEKPAEQFRIAGHARIEAEQKHGQVQAILHSHPYSLKDSAKFVAEKRRPEWPSEIDQQSFLADSLPWGIVSTDGEGISNLCWLTEDVMPFEKRLFNWFAADCYTFVRDWHKVNTQKVLPNFTRPWAFWAQGKNTIEDGINLLIQMGKLIKLPTEKAEVGDIAAVSIGGFNVINHLGVISGTNKFYHQEPYKYAQEVRWDQWARSTRYVVRPT